MKKLNAKFIASLVMAAVAATSVSVSVSAGDYADPPVYDPAAIVYVTGNTEPTQTNPETPADEKDDTESKGATVVDEDTVKKAVENGTPITVAIDDNGNAILQEAALAAIAAAPAPVTFEVTGADITYTVTIDPKDITGELKDFNLAMDIHITSNDAGINDGFIYIGPEVKGVWPLSLGLTVPASTLEGMDFEALGLYYLDDEGVFSDYSDDLIKNADKSVTVRLRHASAYVISDVDLVAAAEVETGLDADDDDDGEVQIDEPSDTANTGKDDTSVVVNGNGSDTNPVTGTTLALGSLAVFAAAAVVTSKKRK